MYHPNSGCTTGACHTSASKAAFAATYDGDSTCSSCHDGAYAGAPDVVDLVSAVPDGHYDETAHTASATSAQVSAGGTASATCVDCHAAGSPTGMGQLYGQHQGLAAPYESTTCGECHNASESVAAVVRSGWTDRSCSTCHAIGVLPGLEHMLQSLRALRPRESARFRD